MLASTVLADCRAMGWRLSSNMLLASDCRETAIIIQQTATKIKILNVVFCNIRLFRLRFTFLPARESACFPVTFLSLLFWIIFVNRQNQSRSIYPSEIGGTPRPAMIDCVVSIAQITS